MADAQGVSRSRTYWVGSLPSSEPMPRAPMWSGMRAPEDSPRNTSGSPRWVATRFMCAILRPLVEDDDAPITVKSLATTATSRPSMRPKPAILPSAGVRSRSSRRELDVPKSPNSMKVPGSSSLSSRSRASSMPVARRRASRSVPPMARAAVRRRSNSRASAACGSSSACRLQPSDPRVSPSMRALLLSVRARSTRRAGACDHAGALELRDCLAAIARAAPPARRAYPRRRRGPRAGSRPGSPTASAPRRPSRSIPSPRPVQRRSSLARRSAGP